MVLYNEVLMMSLIMMVLCGVGVILTIKNYLHTAVVLAIFTLLTFGALVTLITLDIARLCS